MRNVLFMVIAFMACAQGTAQPSGEQILKNIEANYSGVQDYTVSLDVTVDLDRLKVPRMKATMYFKQPDKTHFVSEGFALLPKEGIGFTPGSLSKRFDVESVKEENAEYLLTLKFKADRTKLRKAFVVVNSVNWTVSQITTPQMGGRQIRAEFMYQQVENHWLPAQLIVTISSDTTEIEPPDPFGQPPAVQRPSQMPRKGSIKIQYSDYHLNTGLKDELFEEKKGEAGK